MTEFDKDGKPQDLPTRVKRAGWLTTFTVLSREHEVLRSMQDRAIAGFRRCPHCENDIAWYGDPAAAKIVLDFSRKAKDAYRAETGKSAPGDIATLFQDLQAEDFQELLQLVADRRSRRQLQAAEAPECDDEHPEGRTESPPG